MRTEKLRLGFGYVDNAVGSATYGTRVTNHDPTEPGGPGRGAPPRRPDDGASLAATTWPIIQKLSAPDRVNGYVHRPRLLSRIDPTQRRLTVLRAPGGFGKTVLLAETFRSLGAAGTVAAWMTVAADDTPQGLDTCFAHAFERAGLPLRDFLDQRLVQSDGDSDFMLRTRLLTHAVQAHGAPCVLVLDELEQLQDKASLAFVNLLIQRAPANFHLAIACREIPSALDVATAVFDDQALMLTADDLRFTRADIARFFGSPRSSGAVASLARQTSGWPIALRIIRNQGEGSRSADAGAVADLASNWMESRLFRNVSERDRELLLDAGLFDWIDADLLDEVLEQRGCRGRIESIATLTGLFEAVGDRSGEAIRLHPLIREHCAQRRMRETPERFQRIHRRIAESLARRGETVAAMRHAAAGSDMELAGDMLESVGALRLWTAEGFASLQAADRLLTQALVNRRPRLAAARCIVLLLSGELDQAKRLFNSRLASLAGAPAPSDAPASADAPPSDLQLELTAAKGTLLVFGCERMDSDAMQALEAEQERILGTDGLDPWTRAFFEYAMLLARHLKGDLASALGHARRAQRLLPADHYFHTYVRMQRGQVAMAQGDVAEAASQYFGARDRIGRNILRDLDPNIDVFISELSLERNRTAGITSASSIQDAFRSSGTPIAACLACAGTFLDLARQREGVDRCLSAAEEMLDFARTLGLPLAIRYLTAERVSALLFKGEVGAAERAWREGGLPDRAAGCLDLESQTWREMEALSCVRLRLLTVRRDFEAGRALLNELVALAAERTLVRTQMRALALGIALEREADRPADAERHMARFLHLYRNTDYARPIARDRTRCVAALEDFLSGSPDAAARSAALELSATLEDNDRWERNPQTFGTRELEVLRRLDSMPDSAIAAALGMTKSGVRYHVANLFDKLAVRDRRSAASRARRLGLLP